MSLLEVRESLSYLRDLDRIEVHLFEATGNLGLAERQIDRMRDATRKLAEFPYLGPERSDLESGIRMLTTGEKSIALYTVQAEERIVLMLRAFYGGEDCDALMRAGNDN